MKRSGFLADSRPDGEPVIRVGVILPEDERTLISLVLPSRPAYIMTGDETGTILPEAGVRLEFRRRQDDIAVRGSGIAPARGKHWKIMPAEVEPDSGHRSGIKVEKVIAGRTFHWRKLIDVFLPGSIEIRLFEKRLILINELAFESYVACVATSEMGSECPRALIESQTIVARSWMLANVEMKHRFLGVDVCNDDCCQRYHGTNSLSRQAREGAFFTRGQVLMYDGNICDARYSKSCGGMMESFETVWGGKPVPYLRVKPDRVEGNNPGINDLSTESSVREWIAANPVSFCNPDMIHEGPVHRFLGDVDEEGDYFRWEVRQTQAELRCVLNERLHLDAESVLDVVPLRRGGSGRLSMVQVTYLSGADEQVQTVELEGEYLIRRVLHTQFLYSSAFIVEKTGGPVPDHFLFKGAGWGHGVGYCQIGALGMSLNGYSTEDILFHYLPGSQVTKIY
ncbi:SpoIID/LytB domain-containing protein [bacterium]|nr:SpoIID/LytB domain-containing protein [bacterium]